MFLMYITADALWIWMEPEALPSLQPVILGTAVALTLPPLVELCAGALMLSINCH